MVVFDVAAVADDASTALDAARPGLQWIGEPDWAPHLAPLPFATALAELRAGASSMQDFAASLPDKWVAQLSLAGTPEQVAAGVADRHDAGATSVVLAPAGSEPLVALEQLSRVVQLVRKSRTRSSGSHSRA